MSKIKKVGKTDPKLFGLFDTQVTLYPLEGMGQKTLEAELAWLRKYYRKFKMDSDLKRIKLIRGILDDR